MSNPSLKFNAIGKASPPELGITNQACEICRKQTAYPKKNPMRIPFPEMSNPSRKNIPNKDLSVAPMAASVRKLSFFSTNNIVIDAMRLNAARIKINTKIMTTIWNFSGSLITINPKTGERIYKK